MSDTRMKIKDVPNSLQTYLREIKDESLLTAAEECTLAGAIASGDIDARTRMIQANLRLVVKIALDYTGRGMVLEDLIGEGNLGLIRAAEEFEPRFGTRFSTYASYWIKQAIRHALINTTSTIRLPAHMVGLLTKWRRAERSLYREWGRVPSFEELATFLGLSETQKSLVAKAHRARHLKLGSNVGSGTEHWTPEELGNRYEPVESLMEAEEDREMLLHRLERLDHRERTVLALRYGLEGELPLTLKEIGRRLGVTREWVRKIEIRAVSRLHSNEEDDRNHRPLGRRTGQSSRPRRSMPAAEHDPAGIPATQTSYVSGSPRKKGASRPLNRRHTSRRAEPAPAAPSPSF
jgi:RNA polymerase primary sigma factor